MVLLVDRNGQPSSGATAAVYRTAKRYTQSG